MLRKIIKIDEEKCIGCGLCVNACQEGAIGMVDGKARLMREDYCDGLGNCLPVCPTDAISFETREITVSDKKTAKGHPATAPSGCPGTASKVLKREQQPETLACGCPGTESKRLKREQQPETLACGCPGTESKALQREQPAAKAVAEQGNTSQLQQWPIQIKLVPVNAPYFDNSHLLVAADCAAYAHGNFHNQYMRNKITLIGCPKLDAGDYAEKLAEIIRHNNIKSLTVARMEVPCCGGLETAVKQALINSGKMIPWQVVTISTDGQIVED